MAMWVQFQCSESVTMRLRFQGMTSTIENHRNFNMFDSPPAVNISI